jgi:hypothetical protein
MCGFLFLDRRGCGLFVAAFIIASLIRTEDDSQRALVEVVALGNGGIRHHALTNEDLPRRETWIGTPPELMRSSQANRVNSSASRTRLSGTLPSFSEATSPAFRALISLMFLE